MHSPGHAPPNLIWNVNAIRTAASNIGVTHITDHLGSPLPPTPTFAAIAIVVAALHLSFHEAVLPATESDGAVSVVAA